MPRLVKGGFIFGAEGGDGVLLHRTGHGWTTPQFYGMGSACFGLQIGLEQAELVFIINSKRALRGIEKGDIKLGAGAGITVVTLSIAAPKAPPPPMAATWWSGRRARAPMAASPSTAP